MMSDERDDPVLNQLENFLSFTKTSQDNVRTISPRSIDKAIAIQKAQARVIKSAQVYVDDYIHDEITRIPLRDALAALDEVKK